MTKILSLIGEVRSLLADIDRREKIVGFVPTMGYLHHGHLSLVAEAKKKSAIVIVSIFVNPSQFGVNEDFNKYPRDLQRDLKLLDYYDPLYIFNPIQEELYASDHKSWIAVNDLGENLCGKIRKGHFQGVATIVAKLLNIVSPDLMFMGEKDFQQLVILEKMIEDLNFPTQIVRCPTKRENNGLAMSSRNKYLTAEEKDNAGAIYQALKLAREMYKEGIHDSAKVVAKIRTLLENSGGKVEYIEIVDSRTLRPVDLLKNGCRVLIAAYYGKTRLIDNCAILD